MTNYNDDDFDILGQNIRPVVRAEPQIQTSDRSLLIKIVFYVVVFLVGYTILFNAWESLRKWRERTYRLAMRRKHGIPDTDHRPFNIAYAGVVNARQESDAATRRLRTRPQPPAPVPEPRNDAAEQTTQRRIQRSESAWGATAVPGRYPSASKTDYGVSSALEGHSINLGPTHGRTNSSSFGSIRSNPITRSNRASPFATAEGAHHREPRGTQANGDHHKVQGPLYSGLSRGAKRVMGDESDQDDDDNGRKRAREKRARNFSLQKDFLPEKEDMEVDSEEENGEADVHISSRGKKRDRADAASTFGGDDEESISEHEHGNNTRRRQRKRPTVSKRRSDGAIGRGKKRDRAFDGSDDDAPSEPDARPRLSRKKRGRKNSSMEIDDDHSDKTASVGGSSNSGRRRRIGEIWESNGIKYKMGPDGQRLRQAIVKRARQKFTMPSDSQHPDRQANLEICVETWMTEEEYQEAKNQYLLAWQEPPRPAAQSQPATSTSQSSTPGPLPSGSGKDLLLRPIARVPSTDEKSNLRINPFLNPPVPGSNKRIASSRSGHVSTPISPIISAFSDSTNFTQRYRTFSKWEKQDLEAQAMMRMRESSQKKEAEKLAKEQAEKEKEKEKEREKERAAANLLSLAKPAESKAQAGFAFAPSATNTSTTTTAPVTTSNKPAAPLFPFPTINNPAETKPSTAPLFPPAPTPAAPSPAPSFSFPAPVTASPAPIAAPTGTKGKALDPSKFPFGPASIAPAPPAPTTVFPFAPGPSVPAAPTAAIGEKKPEAGNNLLTRLVPPTQAQTMNKMENKPAVPGFSFTGPVGAAPSNASAPNAATPGPAKFNFAGTSKPAVSALATPLATPDASKPAPTFPFPSAPTAPATASSSAAPAPGGAPASGAAPMFSFGFGAGSTTATNTFGNTANMNMNTNTATPATPATAPSLNGFRPAEVPKPMSPFSAPSKDPANPASSFSFKNQSQNKPAVNTTSAFGQPGTMSTGTMPTPEAPKSPFTFAPAQQPASGTSTSGFAGFGNTAAAKPSGSVAFSFGGSSNTGSAATPAANTTNNEAASKPGFSFNTSAAAPTEAPKSAFSFGNAATAPATGTPAFGSGDSSANKSGFTGFGALAAKADNNNVAKKDFANFGSSGDAGKSAFPGSGGTTGSNAMQPGGSNKPATGFGGFGGFGAAKPSTTQSQPGDAPKQAFGFNPAGPTFSGFGTASNNDAGKTTAGPAFGGNMTFGSGSNAFGGNSTGATTTSRFGPAATPTSASSETPNFSFGPDASKTGASPFFGGSSFASAGSTKPTGAAAAPMTAPSFGGSAPAAGGPAAFGFGAPAGNAATPTFGSTGSTGQQSMFSFGANKTKAS